MPLCVNGIAGGREDSRYDLEWGGVLGPVARTLSGPLSPHISGSGGSWPLTMCVPSAGSPVSLLSLIPVSDGMIQATFKSCQPNCLSPCGSFQSLTETERSPPERQMTPLLSLLGCVASSDNGHLIKSSSK